MIHGTECWNNLARLNETTALDSTRFNSGGGGVGRGIPPTSYNGLYGKAPLERGTVETSI